MEYKEAYDRLGTGEWDIKEAAHVVVNTLLNKDRIEKKCGMWKNCKDHCKECLFNVLNEDKSHKDIQ